MDFIASPSNNALLDHPIISCGRFVLPNKMHYWLIAITKYGMQMENVIKRMSIGTRKRADQTWAISNEREVRGRYGVHEEGIYTDPNPEYRKQI